MSNLSKYIKAEAPAVASTTAELLKSGATTVYQSQDDGDLQFGRATDFFTLSVNNPFGNLNRFTDDLGGATYANDIVIDWSTCNVVDGTVLGYFRTPLSNNTLTNHINAQPYTKASFSDWYVTNVKQLFNIFNYNIFRNYVNYTPFNHNITSSTERLWTSTRENVSNGVFYAGVSLSVSNQSALYKAFLCRKYTLAELGL